jgi:hypothetical protein
MYLRPHSRSKDGKAHAYWSLVETVRTPDGPRQRTLCYLGELNRSAQARWVKTVEAFNEQGDTRQLNLFPSHGSPPDDDPDGSRVLLNKVRLERTRAFGSCFLGLELWKRLELDRFFEEHVDCEPADVPWSRIAALLAINRLCAPGSELAIEQRWYPSTALDDLLQDRGRQDQLDTIVSLPGPHPAAQDETGAASEGALRRVVRSRVRRSSLRSDQHLCGRRYGKESDGSAWLLARSSARLRAVGDRADRQQRRLPVQLRNLRRQPQRRLEIRLRRITDPSKEQKSLLRQLGISLPEHLRFQRECSANSSVA